MKISDFVSEAKQLDVSEQILLVENLWDQIAEENDQLPMPEWHKQELEKRTKEYNAGNVQLKSWNDVHSGLRAKYK